MRFRLVVLCCTHLPCVGPWAPAREPWLHFLLLLLLLLLVVASTPGDCWRRPQWPDDGCCLLLALP